MIDFIQEFQSKQFIKFNDLEDNSAVGKVYGYTNENLRGYMDLLNLQGGRVATVGSSGDQAFYAVFHDCEEVNLIDANPITQPFVELKKSAIENMTYKEFLDYWSVTSMLENSTIEDLMHEMSEESRSFWKYLIRKGEEFGQFHTIDEMIHSTSTNNRHRAGCEFYNNESAFNTLKSKLKNFKINYTLANFNEFPKVLEGEYSSINLSNIYDYVESRDFYNVSNELINKNLKTGGVLMPYYVLFGTPAVQRLHEDIDEWFKNTELYMIDRASIKDPNKTIERDKAYPAVCLPLNKQGVYIYEK